MSISLNFEMDEDDIVSSCSRREKQRLLKELLKNMDIADVKQVFKEDKDEEKRELYTFFIMPGYFKTPMEADHNSALLNLSRRYISMSKEDCDLIINLSKKY
jgi:hypothetical protein